jgi:hypothetical protein
MNDQAPQGMRIEAAILAHLQMDLYTPPHPANELKAETFPVSQKPLLRDDANRCVYIYDDITSHRTGTLRQARMEQCL